jgi:alkylation response protein AidB-like acyl-CoA dehydrogenase
VELDLTADQRMFAETTRSYLRDSCPTSALRDKRFDPDGFDRAYWRQGAELGWTTLLVPEDDGGGSVSGRGVCDLTLVAYEFGRFAAPGPLGATNVVAAAVARSGSADLREKVLPGLLDGSTVATWAYAEPVPHDRLGTVTLTARPTDDGYVLDGVKAPVEAAAQSDLLLVTADSGDGLTQLLVPADSPGVTVTPMRTIDTSRRFARVGFDQVAVPGAAVVGQPSAAAADVEHQLQLAVVVQLAEMLGAMDRALEITTDWLFNRFSFGRPLASYQAIKHRFVDLRAWLEAGNAIADAAANRVQDGSPAAAEYVSAGKSFLGDYGPDVVHECVQFHGGIGVTFEHDLHLFLRRVTLGSQLYGTPAEHRERLAAILEEREHAQ